MKKIYFLLLTILITATSLGQNMPIITAIVDGDCSGGNPKLLEIYADGIVDFSLYSLENQTNANTTWGATQDLSALGTVTNAFVYVTTTGSATAIASEFPSIASAPTLTTGTMNLNGDDRVRIIVTANSMVVDQYGVDSVDGSGQTWEYADSYAKRVDGNGPNATFTESEWTIPGAGTLNTLGTCQGGMDTFETLMGGIGTYTTTMSSTPTVSITGSVSSLDYFEGNGPSNEDSFNVSGINLTTNITVNAPTNFEISLTSGGPYSNSVSAVLTAPGTVASTPVYVRLVSGLTSNTYMGDITASATGATDSTLALTGTVSPATPQITVNGTIDPFNYPEGSGPSGEDTISVSGLFLTTGITITAPSNFEVSLTTATGFATSVVAPLTNPGSVDPTTIYIRMVAGLLEANYMGDLIVSTTGVTNEIRPLTGSVTPAATCANVGDIIITEIMQNPNAVSDNLGEYFEVYNTTGSAIDMVGWEIVDLTNAGENFTITSSVVVPGNGYAVFVASANPMTNGGITPDYVYDGTSTFLGNGSDEISIQCGATVIDEVLWDNGATFPDPTGVSMELDIQKLNSTDNDNGANWSVAVTMYGDGDLGTPGAINDNNTLSVDSFETSNFSIYPNPSNTGFVNIKTTSNEAVNVTVYNILGKQVIAQELENNTLNVSNLNSGVYLVKLTQNGASTTKKLVIE
ncbi:T9SS type A sorting domain-containing protein [uncultured Lacinutrix sp.]|uniref:T9SS type A sorting domain-containing protein n=1 Tax=uncultured Lacinutrix sp. TaxID=574032 RepID=UPI002628ACDC|nr:T9SS type A sorting domain-containing protein [uncultured Lacinutrix sp.]